MATPGPAAPTAALAHVPTFLGLPAEIRNNIYGLLLCVPQPMTIGARGCNSTEPLGDQDAEFLEPLDTSILACSRHIRAEAIPVFYGQNTFQISAFDDIRLYRASPFTDAAKLNLIKHIVVHISNEHNDNIWNRTRARELRRMAGLERLTVVRKGTDNSTAFATQMVSGGRIGHRNSTSAAFLLIMNERPAISCRLILERHNRLLAAPVSQPSAAASCSSQSYDSV